MYDSLVGFVSETSKRKGSDKDILLVWPHAVNTVGELLRLRVIGQLALHPDHITVWSVSNSTVDGTLATALVPVVSLPSSGSIPIEINILSYNSLGNSTSDLIALATRLSQKVLDESLLVCV